MKNKLFSIFTALAMVLGILVSPFTSAHAAEGDVTKSVTVHKILQSKVNLGNEKFPGTNGLDNKEYVGEDITKKTIESYGKESAKKSTSTIESYFGQGSEEIEGVFFALKFAKGHKGFTDVQAAEGVTEKKYTSETDLADEEPSDIQAGKYVKADSSDSTKPLVLTKTVDGVATKYLVATDNIDEAVGGKTTSTGLKLTTSDLKGEFKIDEIHEKSSYVGKDGATLTDMKAVPVEITLPLVNNDGVVTDAHVYPKNTEEAPKIDKNFASDNKLEAVEDTEGNKDAGADYNNYEKKKATAEAELGKKVPYEVKTEIPADSKLAEAHWDDKMTEGLTFNGDLKVKVGEKDLTAEHYTLEQDDRGFSLKLNEKGLALINGKAEAVTVTLTYSATVNSKAIVDIPEANDITFHYGNTPSQGNTPKPTKPNDNGEVSVEKTWGGEDSDWVEGEYAKFKLVDANTGEDVKETDLDAVEGYKFESLVTLEKGGKTSYTWKGLKKDKSYKVVEVESKTLSDAEYTVNEQGKVEVTNHKSNNPKPLNPTEPKVVNGGKRFVKTNKEGTERLAGAQFLVKNEKDEYLVKKVATKEEKDAVKTTKQKLDEAVATYNGLTADQQAGQEGTNAKDNIAKAQEAYNKAVLASADKYEWTTVKAYNKAQTEDKNKVKVAKEIPNVVKLTSGENGEFEIKELAYGEDYKLEEIKAPEGYALPTDGGNFKFKVEKGSYTTKDVDIKYNAKDEANNAKQIVNNKVSIPQTGGIGSLIFVVAGLAIMAGAYVAYRKNQARA